MNIFLINKSYVIIFSISQKKNVILNNVLNTERFHKNKNFYVNAYLEKCGYLLAKIGS